MKPTIFTLAFLFFLQSAFAQSNTLNILTFNICYYNPADSANALLFRR